MTAVINQELVKISEIDKVELLHVGGKSSSVGISLFDRVEVINFSEQEHANENYRMLQMAIKYHK